MQQSLSPVSPKNIQHAPKELWKIHYEFSELLCKSKACSPICFVMHELFGSAISGFPVSLKMLNDRFPSSVTSIRKFVRQLEKDGWARVDRDPGDRRERIILPTEQLVDASKAYRTKVGLVLPMAPVC